MTETEKRYFLMFSVNILYHSSDWCKLPGWNNRGWIPAGTQHADCRNPNNNCQTCTCVRARGDKEAKMIFDHEAGCYDKEPCGEPCTDSRRPHQTHVVGDKWQCWLTSKRLKNKFQGSKLSIFEFFSCFGQCSCEKEDGRVVTRWEFSRNDCKEPRDGDSRCHEDKKWSESSEEYVHPSNEYSEESESWSWF